MAFFTKEIWHWTEPFILFSHYVENKMCYFLWSASCDRLRPTTVVCLYELSGRYHYLGTYYACHYFVIYAVRTAFNSCLTKKLYFDVFVFKFKHLFRYKWHIIQIMGFFFLTCVRILFRSTLRLVNVKLFHSLLFGKQQNSAIYSI